MDRKSKNKLDTTCLTRGVSYEISSRVQCGNGRRDSGRNDGHGGSSGFRSGSGRPLNPYKNGRGSSRRSF